MQRVVLLHGLEGSPTGAKAQALSQNFDLSAPALPTGDFDACVALATSTIQEHKPKVLVGSSFGGAVALQLIAEARWQGATLLLAPASGFLRASVRLPARAQVLIVHGVHDEVVPIGQSRELLKQHPWLRLVEVEDGHRLSSLLEADALARYVRQALDPASASSSA